MDTCLLRTVVFVPTKNSSTLDNVAHFMNEKKTDTFLLPK